MRLSVPFSLLSLAPAVLGQAFIPAPQGLSEVISEKFPGAKITYKEVSGVCETTDGVKSYSGHVHLPKDFLPDAASWSEEMATGSLFFWYFGGGPGYTTFDGSAVFPCYFNSDGNSTTLNEHSWNENTNMLYIDQPLGVGFSYINLANGTYDLMKREFTKLDDGEDLPELNVTLRQATLNYGINETLTNTTMSTARTLWRFAQVFFNEFPGYDTENDKIAVWAVSYGGLFGPIFASYTVAQNEVIDKESHAVANATTLNIATVGVINAIIDVRAMARGFPDFLQNNTYGLELFDEDEWGADPETFTANCYKTIDACREAVAEDDPYSFGADPIVNELCVKATAACTGPLEEFATNSDRLRFDITQGPLVRKPSEYNTAFLNQPWVQSELGVPLNWTREPDGQIMRKAFLEGTGDVARYNTSILANLIDSGVNVAMAYGDYDLQCNWFSGENISLEIDYPDKESFASAGYADLVTNSSYNGGLVRESGRLSCSRVFQAGHSAGGYQPETLSVIFNRAVFGKDIATGKIDLSNNGSYVTEGAQSARDAKPDTPAMEENVCYVYYPDGTCTEEQKTALLDGSAETKDFVVTSPEGNNGSQGSDDTGEEGGDGTGDEAGSSQTTVAISLAVFMGVLAFITV
ncbi:alpha/beta-hydrolase [Sarocladium strictum]